MVSKRKIALMSKLAIYDKNYGSFDRNAVKFFRQDYIYWKNMKTRFYVFLGCLIIFSLHWLNEIAVKGVDILAIDYKAELTRTGYWLVIVLVLYSLLSGLHAAIEYRGVRRRRVQYFRMLNKLDRMRAEAEDKFEEASDDGAGFGNTGTYNQNF